MRQRLDAGHHLNAQRRRVGVQLLQLLRGVPPAQIPEIGAVFDFVGVLGVQHQGVQPHQRHLAQNHADAFGAQHPIAGAVQHHAVMLKYRRAFGAVGGGLRRFQQRKGAEKLHGAVIFDPQRVGQVLHTVVFGAAGV